MRATDPDDPTSPSGTPLSADDLPVDPTLRRDPLIGRMLGEYKVEERLGHGGMGILYRGVQPVIGKPVAIKVMLPDIAADPVNAQRMVAEARAANAVRHPNIIDIFAFGQLPDGRPYMVMELLEGQSLAEELRKQTRLGADETMLVLDQSMAALEAAHAAGVVHRDLKPENIFVTPGPDGWRVKLIDFGLARREGADNRLTKPGLVMGTPGFMAPEQVRGDAAVTGRADVYAMGIVAWTLIMGREPFDGGSVVEVMHKHLSAPVPALEATGLPEGLEALVLRMMRKDAGLRPDATAVRRAIAELKAAPPAPKQSRFLPIAVLGGLGVVIVASTALLMAGASQDPPPLPPPPPVAVVKPKPIEPAPPPVVPEPVVEAPPPSPGHSWKCSSISDVTNVLVDVNPKWQFFSIAFDYGRPLIVAIEMTKPQRSKQLAALRSRVWACRGTAKALSALDVDEHHSGFHTDLVRTFAGDVVKFEDLVLK